MDSLTFDNSSPGALGLELAYGLKFIATLSNLPRTQAEITLDDTTSETGR